jgi:hypothetical protein
LNNLAAIICCSALLLLLVVFSVARFIKANMTNKGFLVAESIYEKSRELSEAERMVKFAKKQGVMVIGEDNITKGDYEMVSLRIDGVLLLVLVPKSGAANKE